MNSKLKCSNCGAEVRNLSISWEKKYLLFMIPVMLLGLAPMIKLMFFKGNVTKELVVSDTQRRVDGSQLEVIGIIANSGRHTWSGVQVEAEFFDSAGAFVDEHSGRVEAVIQPGDKEHFKFTLHPSTKSKIRDEETKMVVKIAGGYTSPF